PKFPKLQATRHEGSQRSKGTVKIATTSRTVLFAPIDPSTNLRKINRQLLSDELQALAPGQFSEGRVNTRKNIIAADARSEAGVLELLILNKIGSVAVRAFLPRAKNTRAGVITDVDTTTTEDRLTTLIDSGVRVIQVRRLGTTQTVKIVFEGDTLPAHVKIGLIRHSVKPFVPRPLQCRGCFRIGHIAAACPNDAICPKCLLQHGDDSCASLQKCVNCHQAHAATSPDCPRLKTERETCQVKARQNLMFLEAAKVVKDQRKNKRHSDQQSRKLGAGIALPRGQTTMRETDPGVQDSLRPSGMAKTTIPENDGRDPTAKDTGTHTYCKATLGIPPDPAEGTSNPRRFSGVEAWSNRTKTTAAGSSMQTTMGKVINLVFTTLRRLLELLPPSEFRTTLRSLLSLEKILGTFF
ncbi:hypothetical protein HPB47_018448, partial [Ixodes persulcatus]